MGHAIDTNTDAQQPLHPGHYQPSDIPAFFRSAALHRNEGVQPGVLLVNAVLSTFIVPQDGVLKNARSFRRTQGGANTTSFDIQKGGTTLLEATMDHPQANGDDTEVFGDFDNTDPANLLSLVKAGDKIDVVVTAVETVSPAGGHVWYDYFPGLSE